MKDLMAIIAGLILIIAFIYGMYWIAKTVSYSIFYEDMVIETIRDTVNQKYLN